MAKAKQELPRFPCPFYGFAWHRTTDAMYDTEDNQCALVGGGAEPCQVEREHKSPDWRMCPKFAPGLVAARGSEVMVYPRERHTPHTIEQPGMSLADWEAYTMSSARTRPRWKPRWI